MRNKEIQCPEKGRDAGNCKWVRRDGFVRDFPEVGVEECVKCHLVSHASDLRDEVNYETGSMHDWSKGYGGTLELPKEDVDRRMHEILKLNSEQKFEKVLDFGSGRGEMLEVLGKNFDSYGYEPELGARSYCGAKGLKVFESWNEIESQNIQFDLITMFHVIEHLYSPHEELIRVSNSLRNGGMLVIETPNSQDALLSLYKSRSFSNFTYWSHHPMLHSQASLDLLLRSNGFSIHTSESHQRYNLANHLYWLSKGLPGGHEIFGTYFSEETNKKYSSDLQIMGMNDTLWFVGIKD